MKIGDLVFDSSFGRHGIIVDYREHGTEAEPMNGAWIVLYEDGQIFDAFDNELEVIDHESG